MEWELWLDKDEKIKPKKYSGMTKRQLEIQASIDSENDSDNQYYTKSSWELFLDKNNAIETDHKKEKKVEWDGKFSNSTIRDDVKDDKTISEEESLEELTDGKLEEVEKLKSWELFLDKALASDSNVLNVEAGTKPKKENMHGLGEGERHQRGKAPIKGKGVGTPEQVTLTKPDGTKDVTTQPREEAITAVPPVKTPQKNDKFMGTKGTNNMTSAEHQASAQRVADSNPEHAKILGFKTHESLGAGTNKPTKTDEQLNDEFNQRVQPEKKSKPMSKKQLAARAAKKSWEVWLTKETKEDKMLGTQLNEARAVSTGKVPESKLKPLQEKDAKQGEITSFNANKWKSWLEKMQGAGDARFGNQHLTGLDQKPVDDEESEANIMPEKDRDKPYKGLKTEEKHGRS